jgi:hypothetical protein
MSIQDLAERLGPLDEMRSTPAARRFTLGTWCWLRDHGMPSIELRSPRSPQTPASTQPNLPALVARYAELNDDDALVGLSGLSIADHPHSIEFEDRTLSSWCVWDPFFLVLALGGSAVIRSTDPQTGTTVRLTFEHGRVTEATPAGTIISIVVPSPTTTILRARLSRNSGPPSETRYCLSSLERPANSTSTAVPTMSNSSLWKKRQNSPISATSR